MPTKSKPSKPLASHFCTRKRGKGPDAVAYVTLRASRPEWLQDAVYAAHGGDMPNDWTYAECLAACEEIDSGDLTEDTVDEHADGRVDVYTADRIAWAAEHFGHGIFDEGEAADLYAPDASIADRIGVVQYCAIRNIASTMLAAARAARHEVAA